MSTPLTPSFYNGFLSSPLSVGGSETEVYVNTLQTLTGETILGIPVYASQGYIIVDPLAQFGTQPEIISFTGIDLTGVGFTGCTRGLSSVTTGSVTANKTYHGTGTSVIISWGCQDINDIMAYIATTVSGATGTATNLVAGSTKLSVAAASPTNPIAVGDNDPRVPTANPTTLFAPILTPPVGTIDMYGGATAPTGFLLCDGTGYSNATTYAALYAVIGYTYGGSAGTFNVPDLRGRVPIGVGTGTGGGASGTGLPTGGSALTAVPLAGWKGEEKHQLITAELASHTHTTTFATSNPGAGYPLLGVSQQSNQATMTSNSTGSDTAHNNIHPVMGVNFIIKY